VSNDLQGTEQWLADRAGKITASRFKDVMAWGKPDKYGKREPQKARTTYMLELCFERLSQKPKHQAKSASMRWGTEQEPFAHEAYEMLTGNCVNHIGFIAHPKYDWLGCSPDGLVNSDGGIESKCPYSESVHITTWLEGMPEEHMAQVQGCMFVTGRKWWDFLSFDPRQSEDCQLYIQTIYRDEKYLENLHTELVQFNLELNRMVDEVADRARMQMHRLSA